ncbi:MAG: ABC transporter substrate-binding protein [Pyrobaculum sp.]
MKKLAFLAIAIAALLAAIIYLQSPAPPTETPPETSPTPTQATPITTVPPSPTAPVTTPTPQPQQCSQLEVLTRHPTDILDATRSLFLKSEVARRYGIKDVKFRPVPAAQWIQIIKAGGADVAWGGGPTTFDTLYKEGLLSPLEGSEVKTALAQIPHAIGGMPMVRTGPDGKVYWVAWAISSFGLTINAKVLQLLKLPEPKDWVDLTTFDYGRAVLAGYPAVGLAQLTRSTSTTRMAEIVLQAYGWGEGWRVIKLTAANGKIYAGSEPVRDDVIAGGIGVGWTIDFYGYTAQLQNPDAKYILPRLTLINGDPIAVVANTRCREAAEAFVAWVLTEGQVVVFDPKINRMPINPNVFNTPEGQRRQDLKAFYSQLRELRGIEFNESLALAVEYVVMYYFDAAVTDNHDVLQRVWGKIVKAYLDGKIDRNTAEALARELAKPVTFIDPESGKPVTLTLEYAISINERVAKDPTYRDKIYAAWREAARRQYLEVEKKV